ncbi:IS4 family transposase [Myxosarcina sp. GI1(2024)]
MLNQLYRNHLSRYLSDDQLITLEVLVYLIQTYKQVKIERLAAYFPLPIKYESRRRRIQRFLKSSALSVSLVWFPIVKEVVQKKFLPDQTIYLVLDRTQWQDKNLFMVGVVMAKRALPIYWQFLEKKGASNFAQQKAILRPVLKLFKQHQIVILGDREFQSVELAKWLTQQQVYFVLRQRKSTKIMVTQLGFTPLKDLDVNPGDQRFYQETKVTQLHQVSGIYLGVYWRRIYRGMGAKEPWYLLTNLPNLPEAVKAYKKRVGIEAMFKDCKSGGYNLEGSQAQIERLTRLVLLIAIAYTHSVFKG